jgi:hypothetical protein
MGNNPLDTDDAVEASLDTLPPEAMDPGDLAEALERLAHEARLRLSPVQFEALFVAGRRLRQLGGLREACLFHLEVIERLERELARFRPPVTSEARG